MTETNNEFRCTQPGCHKLLGKTDEDGNLIIDSNRTHERVKYNKDTGKMVITCKNTREHSMAKEIKYEFEPKGKE